MEIVRLVIACLVGVIVADIGFVLALALCHCAARQDPESDHYRQEG